MASRGNGFSSWSVIPRGGSDEDTTTSQDSDSAAIEEVLYLPGLLDVELTHSDQVRQTDGTVFREVVRGSLTISEF